MRLGHKSLKKCKKKTCQSGTALKIMYTLPEPEKFNRKTALKVQSLGSFIYKKHGLLPTSLPVWRFGNYLEPDGRT